MFSLRCHVTTFPISRQSQIIFSHTGRSRRKLLDIPWFVSGAITPLCLTWRIAEGSNVQRNFQRIPKDHCFDSGEPCLLINPPSEIELILSPYAIWNKAILCQEGKINMCVVVPNDDVSGEKLKNWSAASSFYDRFTIPSEPKKLSQEIPMALMITFT